MQKILIITDSDLDGCGSCLLLKWLYHKHTVECYAVDRGDPRRFFEKFDFSKYTKVYITDITLEEEIIPIVDKANVYIFDHHKSHFDNKSLYQNATTILKEYYTSCTKLIFDLFKDKTTFTDKQKMLVYLIDDYDCFKLKYKQSRYLDSIYREYKGDSQSKLQKFIEDFNTGFSGFTPLQKNVIKFRQKILIETIKELEFYKGFIDNVSCVSVFGGKFNNDIALYTLNRFKCDACIIVMPGINRVSFRRSKNSNTNLLDICKKYCNGIGHEYAAGGEITETFLELMKDFKKVI